MRWLDAVHTCQLTPVPAEAERDGPERIAAPHDVLAAGDLVTLVAVDDLYAATLRR